MSAIGVSGAAGDWPGTPLAAAASPSTTAVGSIASPVISPLARSSITWELVQ